MGRRLCCLIFGQGRGYREIVGEFGLGMLEFKVRRMIDENAPGGSQCVKSILCMNNVFEYTKMGVCFGVMRRILRVGFSRVDEPDRTCGPHTDTMRAVGGSPWGPVLICLLARKSLLTAVLNIH